MKLKLPQPKTIAIVIVAVVLINVAVYYATRDGASIPPIIAPPSGGGTTAPRRRAASMGESTLVTNNFQGGRDIVDPTTGELTGYDFT